MKRYFEIITVGGRIAILSEDEIEKYKPFVREVRTELTPKEITEIHLSRELTPEDIKVITG